MMPYKDPEKKRAHERLYQPKWRKRHKDRLREKSRTYEKNPARKKSKKERDRLRDRRAYTKEYEQRTHVKNMRSVQAKREWERDKVSKRPHRKLKIIKRRYGLTPEQYHRMLDDNGGMCAVCRIKLATVVDHNHKTMRVRGLLCHSCNTGLGMFGDSVETLLNAIAYLKEDGAN